jgi:hypothetical protein
MKLCFATGVLAIPSALNVVGYGPGVILLVCWGSMTTCRLSFPGANRGFVRSELTLFEKTMPISCTHSACDTKEFTPSPTLRGSWVDLLHARLLGACSY